LTCPLFQLTLFAGTAAQVLGFIQVDDRLKDVAEIAVNILNFVSYLAIISNLLATTAAVLMFFRLISCTTTTNTYHPITSLSDLLHRPELKPLFIQRKCLFASRTL
jgi:hypothetical protein